MKKVTLFITGVFIWLAFPLLASCSSDGTAELRVVTSTSLLAQGVDRIGGDKVDVVNIIPPAQCPGHFDVSPGDIQKLADADLFLLHGWQGEKFSAELIATANNPDLTVVSIDVTGNWMTPATQQEGTDRITAALSQVDIENSTAYQETASQYKELIAAKDTEIKSRLVGENLSSVNVMCAEQQAGFVKWVGLNVIATFGRPESITIQVQKDLVDQGRETTVTIIIDNLQSGQDAGKGIAEELGCDRIIISNFPGGLEDTDTWERAIDRNIEIILAAIAR